MMEDIFPQHTEVINTLFEGLTDEELDKIGESLKTVGFQAVDLFEQIEGE